MKQRQQQRTILCVRAGDTSEAPEHGHSLTDPHVLVVEVAEAGEGEGGQNVQPRVGHFNGDVSMHIISYYLAQTPKQERKAQISKDHALKSIHFVVPFYQDASNVAFFHLLPSAFPGECSVPTQGASISKTKQNIPHILLKIHGLAQSFLEESKG